MTTIANPNAVFVRFSDAGATELQLHAFRIALERELTARFPRAEVRVAYKAGEDAPVVAKADGVVSHAIAGIVHKLYAPFSTSAAFSALSHA